MTPSLEVTRTSIKSAERTTAEWLSDKYSCNARVDS